MSTARETRPRLFPMEELVALLRARGLSIGVREYLRVGRLLARWDDPDPATLRAALAGLLARNLDEVAIVREAFDTLYLHEGEARVEPQVAPRRRRRWGPALASFAGTALVLAAVGLGAWLHRRELPPPVQPPAPIPSVQDPDPPPLPQMPTPVPIPRISRVRVAAAALVAFAAALAALRRRRSRKHARVAFRRDQRDAIATLPDPTTYELALPGLRPPFSRHELDDAASVLARGLLLTRRSEMDVERTVARTLRAGLAPQIVLKSRRSLPRVVVLEDTSDEMRAHQARVHAALEGLATRGVPLERWRFHADASWVEPVDGRPGRSLASLARIRAGSPLLVVSTGLGLVAGSPPRTAPWLATLRRFAVRAWLHPVTDESLWSSAQRDVPASTWPLTGEGLVSAARLLATGAKPTAVAAWRGGPASRSVVALDVARLRWLLSFQPDADARLLELLRQRFCAFVPEAAVGEALAAGPMATSPGVGPTAEAVRRFLLTLLDASRPLEDGSFAQARWRLDRALQAVGIPEEHDAGMRELSALADGPFASAVASEVERAVDSDLPHGVRDDLRRGVLRRIDRRAVREGRHVERVRGPASEALRRGVGAWASDAVVAGLVAGVLVGCGVASGLLARVVEPSVQWAYDLSVDDSTGPGSFGVTLRRHQGWRAPAGNASGDDARVAPDVVVLHHVRDGTDAPIQTVTLDGVGEARGKLQDGWRPGWLYAQALAGDVALQSNVVSIGEREGDVARAVGRIRIRVWRAGSPRLDLGAVPITLTRASESPIVVFGVHAVDETVQATADRAVELTAGEWTATVTLDGYQEGRLQFTVPGGVPGIAEMEVVLERERPSPEATGNLVVHVVDAATGKPVAARWYRVTRAQERTTYATDESVPLAPGTLDIAVVPDDPGFERGSARAEIRVDETTPITVQLARTSAPEPVPTKGGLTVTVVDAESREPLTARWTVENEPKPVYKNGESVLLPAGRFRIIVTPEDGAYQQRSADVEVRAGEGTGTIVEVYRSQAPAPVDETGTLIVHVVDAKGDAVPAHWQVFSRSPEPKTYRAEERESLPPGNVNINVLPDDGGDAVTARARIRAGDTTEITVTVGRNPDAKDPEQSTGPSGDANASAPSDDQRPTRILYFDRKEMLLQASVAELDALAEAMRRDPSMRAEALLSRELSDSNILAKRVVDALAKRQVDASRVRWGTASYDFIVAAEQQMPDGAAKGLFVAVTLVSAAGGAPTRAPAKN